MDTKQLLSKFIDSTVAADDNAAKEALSGVATLFVQRHLGLQPVSIVERFANQFNALVENLGFDSPIRISRSGIVSINGKNVGSVAEVAIKGQPEPDESGVVNYGEEHFDDPSNEITGIQFTNLDGTFSKEFTSLEELLNYLTKTYGVK